MFQFLSSRAKAARQLSAHKKASNREHSEGKRSRAKKDKRIKAFDSMVLRLKNILDVLEKMAPILKRVVAMFSILVSGVTVCYQVAAPIVRLMTRVFIVLFYLYSTLF